MIVSLPFPWFLALCMAAGAGLVTILLVRAVRPLLAPGITARQRLCAGLVLWAVLGTGGGNLWLMMQGRALEQQALARDPALLRSVLAEKTGAGEGKNRSAGISPDRLPPDSLPAVIFRESNRRLLRHAGPELAEKSMRDEGHRATLKLFPPVLLRLNETQMDGYSREILVLTRQMLAGKDAACSRLFVSFPPGEETAIPEPGPEVTARLLALARQLTRSVLVAGNNQGVPFVLPPDAPARALVRGLIDRSLLQMPVPSPLPGDGIPRAEDESLAWCVLMERLLAGIMEQPDPETRYHLQHLLLRE